MNKGFFLNTITFLLFLIFLFSCKTLEKTHQKGKVKITRHPKEFLIEKLKQNESNFKTLSAKNNIDVINSKKQSFKSHLRIQKDSAIWMSITPILGIEVARILITNDSVKYINRIDKEYFLGDFDYIDDVLGVDLDYQMLEALLIGNSVDFEREEKKIKTSIDRKKGAYFISTIKKRKTRKELRKDKAKIKGEQNQAIWLNPSTFKVIELLITQSSNTRNLQVSFEEFKSIDEHTFPNKINYKISAKDTTSIVLKYANINFDKSLSFPFKIPSSYVQVKK